MRALYLDDENRAVVIGLETGQHVKRLSYKGVRNAGSGERFGIVGLSNGKLICIDMFSGARVWSKPKGTATWFTVVNSRVLARSAKNRVRQFDIGTGKPVPKFRRDRNESALNRLALLLVD